LDEWADVVLFDQKGRGCDSNYVAGRALDRKAVWCEWVFDLVAISPGIPLHHQPLLSSPDGDATPWLRELQAMDVVFVKERSLLSEYASLEINACWLDQGCPSDIPECDLRLLCEWDVYIFGQPGKRWLRRTLDATHAANAGWRVLFTSWPTSASAPSGCKLEPWVPPFKLHSYASKSLVTLGVDARGDIDGYWSDRLWLACGMGSCHLRRKTSSQPLGPFALYNDCDELLAQLEHYKRDDVARRRVGKKSREWVMDQHTYRHRCKDLLDEVERCHTTKGNVASAAGQVA
jgi:hypothetical protein